MCLGCKGGDFWQFLFSEPARPKFWITGENTFSVGNVVDVIYHRTKQDTIYTQSVY